MNSNFRVCTENNTSQFWNRENWHSAVHQTARNPSYPTNRIEIMDQRFQLVSVLDAKKPQAKTFKRGFHKDDTISSRLVEAYTTAGEIECALQILEHFPASINSSSLNQLISSYIQKKLYNQVFSLFSWMYDRGLSPDERAIASVLQACSDDLLAIHFIQQIHAKFIDLGYSKNPLVCNPLIDLYSKNGLLDSAMEFFGETHMRDSVSWIAMISGCSQNSRELEGILLYCEMRKSGAFPIPHVFSSIIIACTKIELFGLGKQLHCLIIKWGFSSKLFVCNALVTLYSRCGNLTSAEQIFSEMQCKDEVTYNTLISGLAMQGSSEKYLHS